MDNILLSQRVPHPHTFPVSWYGSVLGSASHLVKIDCCGATLPCRWRETCNWLTIEFWSVKQNFAPLLISMRSRFREPLPCFPLPLQVADEPVVVDLSTLVSGVYDRVSYDLCIDYSQSPPFSKEDQVWMQNLLSATP
ncbi:DUF4058 family protein [Nodosilinea sp. LEGE 06152]|uniref:DUF4058 family protein n=1 Tax=Nodosilinea sp. LEGE 06152 TaxID=2777966 RepID=UPI001881EB7E|nr:DUF4058 family protein [Nodosilinea sp. LEGE 06152]MBE9156693.1 DUF4058 family protein [Nodosilinea sp. LEGE 06152]